MQAQLDAKNSYFELFKTDFAKTKEAEVKAKKEATTYGYDKVYAHYDDKIAGSTLYEHRKIPKTVKKGGINREDASSVVTSSQSYGWREPYDTFAHGHARSGVC